MSMTPADIAALAARIRSERGEAYARDMLAELRGILAEEDGIAPVEPYPLQYGWSNKGAAGGKKFRWYNDETKENRYQISEPGTRKAKQGEQPPKPQRPAKPDAATLQTELQGLNRADITPEHVEAVTRQLVGLTKEQMHGMREGLGIPEKGWKTLPKGRLAAKLVEHVRGGGKPAQKPGKAGQQPFDPDVVAQSIVAARGGSGDVEGALAALSSLTLPQLRAVRERMGAEKGGRSRKDVSEKIIAAVRQGGKAGSVTAPTTQPSSPDVSTPAVPVPTAEQSQPETPAEQTPDATPALHPEAQKHMDTFQKSLDGATHLSPEQKTYYAESVHKVLGRMTPAMLQRFGANFHGKVHFAADLDSLREHLADSVKHNPTLVEKVRKAKSPGGAYLKSGGKASFALDGDRATTSETSEYGNKEASGIYAHEFAHAIDGMSKEMSKSEGWQKAFQSEISGKKLTRYADTDPSEAFAEFGRLLLSGEHDHTAIKQVFPQAFAVWKDAGLVDDPQAEPDAPTGAPAPVKMAEMFGGKVDLGEQGHVDEKLNVASPTPQPGDSGGASPGTPSPDVPQQPTPATPAPTIDLRQAARTFNPGSITDFDTAAVWRIGDTLDNLARNQPIDAGAIKPIIGGIRNAPPGSKTYGLAMQTARAAIATTRNPQEKAALQKALEEAIATRGAASQAPETPGVSAPATPTTRQPSRPIDITATMKAIEPGIGPGGSVLARDLMRQTPPEQRQAMTDAILAAAERGDVVLQRHDHPALLTDEERAEMPRGPDGTYYTSVSFRSDAGGVKPSVSSPVSSTGATEQQPAEDTMQSITHAYQNAATLQPAEFSAALSTVDGLGKADLVQAAGTLGMKGVKGWSADRLRREIRERLKRQRNGEGAGKKMAGGTSGKRSTPAAPAAPAPSSPDVARAFLAHPRAGNLVSLADLQQATGLDTATLHQQINALRKAGILTASGVEGRESQSDPTGHKRLMDAGIREGSDVLGYVSVREGAEEKLKEMAGKKSERSAAETSAAWDAAKKAYEQVYQKAKFTTGVVKIPDLIDAMRKIAPDLSPVDIREMLQQWQKEDKLTLGLANDPRLEPRAAEGVHTNRGLRMYVQMHPEA